MIKRTLWLILILSIVYWAVTISVVSYYYQTEYASEGEIVSHDTYGMFEFHENPGQNFLFASLLGSLVFYILIFGGYIVWKIERTFQYKKKSWRHYYLNRFVVMALTGLVVIPGAILFLLFWKTFDINMIFAFGLTLICYALTFGIFLLYFVKYRRKSLSDLEKNIIGVLRLPVLWSDKSDDQFLSGGSDDNHRPRE